MAITVNGAFTEFMNDTVNLDKTQTQTARKSRDNLLSNIKSFSGDDDLFFINGSQCLNFGSFARHTKLRPLDDIDMMICIAASDDRKYTYMGNGIYCMGANQTDKNNGLQRCTKGT